MITVTIQIGNTDNKLTQQEWGHFCNQIHSAVLFWDGDIHFSAPSVGWADWQNAAWVFTIDEKNAKSLRLNVAEIRGVYKQDSVAWTEGKTEFI